MNLLNTCTSLPFLVIATSRPTPGAVFAPPSTRYISSEVAPSLTGLSYGSGVADPHPADSRRGPRPSVAQRVDIPIGLSDWFRDGPITKEVPQGTKSRRRGLEDLGAVLEAGLLQPSPVPTVGRKKKASSWRSSEAIQGAAEFALRGRR